MKSEVIYKYIGNGASMIGIPARDLTEEEAKEYGIAMIMSRGLYRKTTVKINPHDNKPEETEVSE